MKIGIVGLPGSGKTTIFNALTGGHAKVSSYSGVKKEANIAIVGVPDARLEALSNMYMPKKTTPAQVQYVDVGGSLSGKNSEGHAKDTSIDEILRLLRPVDALVLVIRNFERPGEAANPQKDLETFESELVLTDLIAIEKRIERVEKEISKGKKVNPKELELLKKAYAILNGGHALRPFKEIVASPLLKGYAFLSAKPCIVVLNNADEVEDNKTHITTPEGVASLEIKGRLEMELKELPPDEAAAFRTDFGLSQPATNRLIQESYALLGLISFFTVGKDEVRAWNIPAETPAQKAAGVIHSDIEKGFIRVEVVSYDDLIAYGSYTAAQKAGKVRLEGKEYMVKDGDVLNFRFNV
ncbi:MAG: redox-regulated ATPase YchF [Dissulfurimicrobium sp.]|uniref:redox-regulated ATPase YchF n=1 Tax=Dissulfurimicrobium sp. TaxID=2022436 RepID=UPI00404A4B84